VGPGNFEDVGECGGNPGDGAGDGVWSWSTMQPGNPEKLCCF
jgi:hypothetical protein